MWRLWINGSWQQAESEDQIESWLVDGHINPSTPIQHATWPQPKPLSASSHFGPMLARARGEPEAQTETLVNVAATIAGVVIFGALTRVGLAVAAFAIAVGVVLFAMGFAEKFARSQELKLVLAVVNTRKVFLFTGSAALILGGAVAIGLQLDRDSIASDCHARVAKLDAFKLDENLSAGDIAKQADTLAPQVSDVRRVCTEAGLASEATEIGSKLEARKLAAQNAAQQKVAAQAAAADHDKAAQFPEVSNLITTDLASASASAKQQEWIASSGSLDDAQARLNYFQGTSVASTDAWSSLSRQVATLRSQIQPHVDQIRAKDVAAWHPDPQQNVQATEETAVVDSVRGPKPRARYEPVLLRVSCVPPAGTRRSRFVQLHQRIRAPNRRRLLDDGNALPREERIRGAGREPKKFWLQQRQVVKMVDY